jgi:site-specific DNA-cytosine methylase
MKVAVICEYSGTVREAFKKLGHEATSFDLLDTEVPGNHVKGNVQDLPLEYWEHFDLAVCHPPCTHLAVSGARWFKDKVEEQKEALDFVRWLMALPIKKIAIENPVSIISSKIRKADQYIQPWQFGHGETKKTGLWLKDLPLLIPTDIVEGREAKVHKMPPGPDRWKERSRTYQGIANAMAKQWGALNV